MFHDTPEGHTYSCSHYTKNKDGICDICLGKNGAINPLGASGSSGTPESWEDGFEKEFAGAHGYVNPHFSKLIKDFISFLLAEQRKNDSKIIEEVAKKYLWFSEAKYEQFLQEVEQKLS